MMIWNCSPDHSAPTTPESFSISSFLTSPLSFKSNRRRVTQCVKNEMFSFPPIRGITFSASSWYFSFLAIFLSILLNLFYNNTALRAHAVTFTLFHYSHSFSSLEHNRLICKIRYSISSFFSCTFRYFSIFRAHS